MRAIAGAIVVLAGTLILICGALLPMLYLAHTGSTSLIPIDPNFMIWIGFGTMVAGAVAVFPIPWKCSGEK
jgi:hypothetical protein